MKSDSFSVERLGLLWDFFLPRIVVQAGWTVAAVAVTYLILALSCKVNSITLYSMGANLVYLPVYFGPLIFATYRNRELLAGTPASTSEKAVLMLGYTLVILPGFVALLWLSINAIGSGIWPDVNVFSHFDSYFRDLGLKGFIYNSAIIASGIPILVSLYTILSSRRSRVLKGVVAVFATLFGMGLMGAVFATWLFYQATQKILENNNVLPDDFMGALLRDTMPVYVNVYTAAASVMVIIGIIMVWRKVKRMQI